VSAGVETQNSTGREIFLDRRAFYPVVNPTSKSETLITFAVGSAYDNNRLDYSLPLAPDDTAAYNSATSAYAVANSLAAQAARAYGAVQNRLLYGNRNGMSIQVAPEVLPSAPFAPVMVQANGLTAMYRCNGNQWQISAEGVLAASELLFWGAVGGTGTFWFPVAPGVTTLPTTPAVVNGQMTVSTVVPPWNVSINAEATVKVGLSALSLGYPLQTSTAVLNLTLHVGVTAQSVKLINLPAADVALGAVAPDVAIGAAVQVPAADVTVAALVPEVRRTIPIAVPSVDVSVAALVPQVVATVVVINVPSVDIAVAALVPSFGDDYWSGLAAQVFSPLGDWQPDGWGS
jgi:hypothetical protein